MTRTECDQCRALGDSPPPAGWILIYAVSTPEAGSMLAGFLSGLSGSSHHTVPVAALCSWPCLADYATAKALIPAEDPQGSAP